MTLLVNATTQRLTRWFSTPSAKYDASFYKHILRVQHFWLHTALKSALGFRT